MQRAVVAAWLLIKESSSLLASLISIACEYQSSLDKEVSSSSPQPLVSEDTMIQIGSRVMNALGRLKHMGAISEAQSALQRICEAFLR